MNARQLFNKWVILGALLFAGFLLLITAVSIGLTSAASKRKHWVCPGGFDCDPRSNVYFQRARHADHRSLCTNRHADRNRRRQLCADHRDGRSGFAISVPSRV